MKPEVQKAIRAIQDTLHEQCKDLGPEDYMQVLDFIGADIDGSIDALREENPELFK